MPDADSVYLHPGQVLTAAEPTTVTTILGSCVSICLRDVRRGVAGMNHFLLPDGGTGAVAGAAGRYGDAASELLLERLLAGGSRRQDLEAKVFGGASVLTGARAGGDHLGARNVAAALAFLERRAIPVSSRDTGGVRGRKLIYLTTSGDALVRIL